MALNIDISHNQRLSYSEKNKNNKRWYKDQLNALDAEGSHTMYDEIEGVAEYRRKKVNYDLFNNILNMADFEYVCQPFGSEAGELPAQMVNRDISSNRIKAIQGLERKRPFSWKSIAVNKEATTRREEEEFKRIKDFIIAKALGPVRQEIETKYKPQLEGRELSNEEKAQIQQQIADELQAMTPDKVRKYMERDHQDPAEVLSNHILEDIIQREDVKRKFEKGFQHGLISAEEIYYVGVLGGKPRLKVVNPLRFCYDKSPDIEFVEDSEWATYEYRMHPSEIMKYFGDQLTEKQIDQIYTNADRFADNIIREDFFNFSTYEDPEYDHNTNRVLHAVWKSLRRIGFLTYKDEEGNIQEKIVGEEYKLNKTIGDIEIEWEWIPEVYEGYKIDSDIYVNMGPVAGQFKDLHNLYECKLPYVGVIYDNLNAQPTSLMDRLKVYQYYYNIVMYRLELLIASDKGKKLLMNINAIPKSSGIDIEKWQYFFESTPFSWFDPSEEGNNYSDVNTMGKVLDMSLASDIGKYIDIAVFMEQQAGKSTGTPDTVLGEISPSQEVGNTKQTIIQTSHILENYFQTHNYVKRNVLQSLIEAAKVAYSTNPPDSITYTMDDMSVRTLQVDTGLLDNSTLGIYISDGVADAEKMQEIKGLAHAAMQNQMAELSAIVSIINEKDSQEAEEVLKASEKRMAENQEKAAESQREFEAQMAQKEIEEKERDHERKKELIVLEEEEKRKTAIQKQAMLSVGFNEDKDADDDGQLDVIEIAKQGIDAQIKSSKQTLEEKKFEQSKKEHDDKIKLENKKLSKNSK